MIPHRIAIAAAALALALALAAPASARSTPECDTKLGGELTRLHVPGLAAGIVDDGRLVCTAVAGQASIEEGRDVTPDTTFMVASVSKTVTATALMQLYEQDRFELEDDVNDYLPFAVRNPSHPSAPITFEQLLTHTSSIVDSDLINCPTTCEYGGTFAPTVTRGADSPIPLRDFVEGYLTPGGKYYDRKRDFLTRRPGTQNEYSNMGATLIGYLVERISGVPFDQYTRQHIFAPLGMPETSWRLAGMDRSRLAMPYDWAASTGYKPFGHYGEPDYPDGMVRTSVNELARFLAMYMNGGTYDGKRILECSTVRLMLKKNHTPLDPDQGLIWFYEEFGDGPEVVGHDGSDLGASANMFFDSERDGGVILLSNGIWRESPTEELMGRLFAEREP